MAGTTDATLENRLIALVHQGVAGEGGWTPLVEALREAMGAVHANFTLRRTDAPMSDLTSYLAGGPGEAMSRHYLDDYHRNDPLPYYRLVPGRAYTPAEVFGPDDREARDRLAGLLQLFGPSELMILRVTEPGGANGWLSVIRGGQGFSSGERRLCERLGEHLGIALGTFVRLNDAQARLASYAAAMDRLSVGIVTLAGDGRIIDADGLITSLTGEGSIMARDPQGRLVLADAAAARVLAAALRDFAAAPTGRPRAIRLSEARRADMLLLPVADRPATGPLTPVLRAYVHTEPRPAQHAVESLIEMFRLTRAEARLALALGEGHSLAEAAGLLGVTLHTARTYSKRIFQKTGTRRQAELVRLLLTSTLSLA